MKYEELINRGSKGKTSSNNNVLAEGSQNNVS